ncbi:hypothetical protein CK203_107307 [Vitis vinifera]|uniref:Uncharacterized protein n=1 Tax=Vitis vinifera TaxID=29760 RepID=A0A438CVQ7_VITVI|nr:hypothetical protein CK203_107307 [Vitis vinifera]
MPSRFGTPRALIFTGHFETLLVYFGTTLVLDSFSVMTGPRAEIDDMMVMIFSEYIEIRLLQLRFTMSDEIAPITLTILYEMMMDLTRRVERIELFCRSIHRHREELRSSDAFIATFDFIDICYFGYLTSTTSPTFSVPTAFLIHFIGYVDTTSIPVSGPPVITVPQERLHPRRRCRRHFSDLSTPLSRVFETFQAMGFLAPLAPRALPDPVPSQFRT